MLLPACGLRSSRCPPWESPARRCTYVKRGTRDALVHALLSRLVRRMIPPRAARRTTMVSSESIPKWLERMRVQYHRVARPSSRQSWRFRDCGAWTPPSATCSTPVDRRTLFFERPRLARMCARRSTDERGGGVSKLVRAVRQPVPAPRDGRDPSRLSDLLGSRSRRRRDASSNCDRDAFQSCRRAWKPWARRPLPATSPSWE